MSRLHVVLTLSVVVTSLPSLARAQDAGTPAPDAGAAAAPTAEDTGDLESLLGESVVTTASRGAERASAAPATVYTISGDEMRLYGMTTIDEALDYLGIGIYTMRPRDYDTGIDVGAQGIIDRDGGRHILVMLDGHVMNSQDTGQVTIHEGLGVPPEAIDHIEVMLGAGSVVYGSNAMTAVINVITRTPTDHATVYGVAGLTLQAPSNVRGQVTVPDLPGERTGLRYHFGAGASVPFRFLGSDAYFTLHAQWLDEASNSYRTPVFAAPDQDSNFQPYPGQDTWGGPAHHWMRSPSVVSSLRVGDFRLSVQGNYYWHGIPLNGRFTDETPGRESREERLVGRVNLTHTTLVTPEAQVQTRIYADFTHWAERTSWRWQNFCYEGQSDGCNFERSSRGRSAGLEHNWTIDWSLDSVFVTTIGFDVRGRDTTALPSDSRDINTGAAPLIDPEPYIHKVTALGAVYGQQIWRPNDWLTLNAGVRVDVDGQFGAHASPRGAAVVHVGDTTLRASYAHAFRAPTTYELYENDRTYRITATNLRPETVNTGELEWRQRISWLDFSVRGFAAFYDDVITDEQATEEEIIAKESQLSPFADRTYIRVYRNTSHFVAYGGSFSFTARPTAGLSLGASLSVVESFFQTPNPDEAARLDQYAVNLMPQWYGNARIAYEFAPHGAALAFAARYAAARKDKYDLPNAPGVGEQLDMRLTFSAPLDAIPGLSLRSSIGYSFNTFLPYTYPGITPEPEPYRPGLTSPMFGMLELRYEVAP